jgi:hypothetical protein
MSVRIATALLVLIAVAGCDKWSDRRVAESKRRGDVVCHAVEAYRAKAGKFPFELKELQPEFLPKIPQPTAGYKEWEYTVIENGTNYYLQVVGSEWGPILGRTSKPQWDYMPGSSK